MRKHKGWKIAADLQRQILSNPDFSLPSISTLADRYHVAYATMWKAVQELKRRGIVESSSGMPIAVSSRIDPTQGVRPSAEKLHASLRERIGSGDFQVGTFLPKREYFALSEKVTRTTVTRALRLLEDDGLIHKKNHRWMVGPRPPRSSRTGQPLRGLSPVVLFASSTNANWKWAFENQFNTSFLVPFRSETANHAIELDPVALEPFGERTVPMPTGRDEIRRHIRALGPRYAGVLTYTTFPRETNIDKWLSFFDGYNKPVVYFDSTGKGGYLRRAAVGRNFYRVHLDETEAVTQVLEALNSRGHRVIAVHGWSQPDWAERRLEIIRRVATEKFPHMCIVSSPAGEYCWSPVSSSRDSSELYAGPEGLQLTDDSSLRKLLAKHQPTALVGLNDGMALEYIIWAKSRGLRVPQDLSLVSFDNTHPSFFFHLSTLDWGFTKLGYIAAHLFIRDIPAKANRDGHIPGPCTFADRGTVGAARRR